MGLQKSERPVKQCGACLGWFDKGTFHPGRALCKKCYLERQKVSGWKSKLKHQYGITPEIYHAMYEGQDGKCYFCDTDRPRRGKRGLAIDHDKETGFVRGLLCRPCNAGWVDEYKRLPKECQDSPRTNAYLIRGEAGDYVESIKRRLASHP